MGDNNRKHNALMRYGHIIKENTFDTTKGVYTVRIIYLYGDFYFHKMRNGAVVEIVKLQRPQGLGH